MVVTLVVVVVVVVGGGAGEGEGEVVVVVHSISDMILSNNILAFQNRKCLVGHCLPVPCRLPYLCYGCVLSLLHRRKVSCASRSCSRVGLVLLIRQSLESILWKVCCHFSGSRDRFNGLTCFVATVVWERHSQRLGFLEADGLIYVWEVMITMFCSYLATAI